MLIKQLSDLFKRPEDDPDCVEFERRIRAELAKTPSVISGSHHRRRTQFGDLVIQETITTGRDYEVTPRSMEDCYDRNYRYLLEVIDVSGRYDRENRIFAYEIDNRTERRTSPSIWVSLQEIRPYIPELRKHQVLDDLANA